MSQANQEDLLFDEPPEEPDMLQALEDRVDQLLDYLHEVKYENHTLNHEWQSMMRRHGELRERIESVVGRLKKLESEEDSSA